MWNRVIGQKRIKNTLSAAIQNHKLAGSYLFYGPEGVGKDAFAIELAKTLNCLNGGANPIEACDECANCLQIQSFTSSLLIFTHALAKDVDPGSQTSQKDEDIETIREELQKKGEDAYHNIAIPRAQNIQVGQIRELRLGLSRSFSGGARRIVIISEADMMNAQAQNAFLKTLEEPHANTLIILTSSNPHRLYATILSRCQSIRFDLLATDEIAEALVDRTGASSDSAEFAARISGGSYSNALLLLGEDIHAIRDQVVAFLRMALSKSRENALNEISLFLPKSGGAGKFLERRQSVEQRLLLLSLWLRDALAVATGANAFVINDDQRADLDKFVSRFGSPKRILSAIASVEEAYRLVRLQVQLRPVMLDLVLNLERALVI